LRYNFAADSFYIMKLCRRRGRPWGIFFGLYKTRHIFDIWPCKLRRATCRRFDTIPTCDAQTDWRTDSRNFRS